MSDSSKRCPFANILGEPGKGIHSARIFGLALNDTLMTVAVALVTAYIYNISFLISFLGWLILGELLHYLFGTDTAGLRMLGIHVNCSANSS
jgi:hypothetical protein